MYNHQDIERKWQAFWEKNDTFNTTESTDPQKNIYVLDMFPYPSGTGLHVGHIEGYTATDVFARYKRLTGFHVLHPIGWDAFGLPAEQYAIETGRHPKVFSEENITNFKVQLKKMGFSYDFKKEINTTDPNYYKWTQWIFLELYKKGLAEYKWIDVNWCPKLGTVLANEEVLIDQSGNSVSERGNYPVVKKPMKQWVLKITNYATRLLEDLDGLDWPPSLIKIQKNWIGLEKDANNEIKTNLRDWIFSRQRFWGEPFPLLFDENDNVFIVKELPVELPEEDLIVKPSFDGGSPLTNFKNWINVEINGKAFRRETNTMPQWAGSSWYYLAFILKQKNNTYIPLNSKLAYQKFQRWLPVDLYIGGQEHAVLHLLYARFWHKFLYDLKIVPTKEPFLKIINQGMVLGRDGQKMSKSKRNGVSPDKIIQKYGADALRIYELFLGPITDDKIWSDQGIIGIHRWVKRVYNIHTLIQNKTITIKKSDQLITKGINKLIKTVMVDLDNFKYNTAISKLMSFVNVIYFKRAITNQALKKFLILLSLFAPHLAEELLDYYFKTNIHLVKWPKYNPDLIEIEKSVLVIQINGKVRAKVDMNPNNNANTLRFINQIKELPNVKRFLKDQEIVQEVFVKNKIINFVVKANTKKKNKI